MAWSYLLRQPDQALLEVGTVLDTRTGVCCPCIEGLAGTALRDAQKALADLQVIQSSPKPVQGMPGLFAGHLVMIRHASNREAGIKRLEN